MNLIDEEVDQRKVQLQEWAHLRHLQHLARSNRLDMMRKTVQEEIADGMEMLFRECRRLRSIKEEAYLSGFNDGWDKCKVEYEPPF